jgi:selenocysteine-specific elongation factor
MNQLVLATAGHIDHGKTSLVYALTGFQTDTMKEESERGITIDLGYAHLNDHITIIDVPGHERFIKNMVAGAASTHLALLVIAADDGIMPQTIEHLDILISLGVRKGFVVITKRDLVTDLLWLELVIEDVKEMLAGKEFNLLSIFEVDSISGNGINELKNQILKIKSKRSVVNRSSNFRMNIDRVFLKDGFGTVVTGTVLNGMSRKGDEIEILPYKETVRVRAIQSHGNNISQVNTGDRAAINFKINKKKHIKRGTVIAAKGLLNPFLIMIVSLKVSESSKWVIKNKQRLKFYIGTSEVLGRVTLCTNNILYKGQRANAIIKLEKTISAVLDDKFIVRSYSPMETIAGGEILKIIEGGSLRKLKKIGKKIPRDTKQRFEYFVNSLFEKPLTINKWKKIFLNSDRFIETWFEELGLKKTKDMLVYSEKSNTKSINQLLLFLNKHYKNNPYKQFVNDETILVSIDWSQEWLIHIKEQMVSEKLIEFGKGGISKTGYKLDISKKDFRDIEKIEKMFLEAGVNQLKLFSISKLLMINQDRLQELIHLIVQKKIIKKINTDYFLHIKTFDNSILSKLRLYFNKNNILSVSDFKSFTGLSRKQAIPLLEYLDLHGYTKRISDQRVIGEELDA